MKALLVDDHALVRSGLISILSRVEEITEIIEASTSDHAMEKLIKEKPDISFIDLRLGKEDGIRLVNKAIKKGLNSKYIILTSSNKISDFNRAYEAGVDGYILKEAFVEDILYAIRVILRGKKFFDQELFEKDLNAYDHLNVDKLTPREQDILIELGKGLSNIEIAHSLFISENTVKKHISNIFSKLELTHRTQAALYANEILRV